MIEYDFINDKVKSNISITVKGEEPVIGDNKITYKKINIPNVEVSLGPEMRSTGEVLGVGRTVNEALYKGFVAAGMMPEKGKILATVKKHDKEEFLPMAVRLSKLGYEFLATEGTCKLLNEAGVKAEVVRKLDEEEPNILNVIKNQEVNLVMNTPTKANDSKRDGFLIRRAAVERNIGVITALDTFILLHLLY